ncbi:hypothetical protein IPM09_04455 [Candidatus Saccharibacteria bacterium]|nr:MAG: hypothetical protein IPM09_04455 [Candidatus Saccharibacteria bacterium]
MAEEKINTEATEEFTMDDASALQYVLEHVRGATPASVYRQSEYIGDSE